MTAPETTRADAAPAADASAATRRPRSLQVTAVAGFVGVLIALAGIGYVAMPLRTPIQDCGTAATFLVDGRVNVFANPQDPPAGASSTDVQANNDEPCQERAADRALPGAAAILAGTLLALGALVLEFFTRLRLSRRTRDALMVAQFAPAEPSGGPQEHR